MSPNQPGQPPKLPIPGVRNLIAVGSGKGGVGKTTVAVNLAVALAKLGHKVGLLDADVYGPNVPLMMGINQTPMAQGERIQPLRNFGVKLMSMGFLGTGDVQLTLIQTAPITGAIVVTTPSAVSLEDARKAIHMFSQVRVEILGIVENMSYLIVPGTNQKLDVFGSGAGKRTAESMGVTFLGEIALDPEVRIGGDTGQPVAMRNEGDPRAEAFLQLARNMIARLDSIGPQSGPKIEITD